MSIRYGFYLDSRSCTGCKACQIACKDKNNLPVGVLWRKVVEVQGGEWLPRGAAWMTSAFAYFVSSACMHCEAPICAEVCPNGAVEQREDGSNRWGFAVTSGANPNHLALSVVSGGTEYVNKTSTVESIFDHRWSHVALVKQEQYYGLYTDGEQVAYALSSGTDNFVADLSVGYVPTIGYYWDGWMEQMQITEDNKFAIARAGTLKRKINIEMLGNLKVGDFCLVHAGFAISKIDMKAAKEKLSLLKEIKNVSL